MFVWCLSLGPHSETTNWLVVSEWGPRVRHQTNTQQSWVEKCMQISKRMRTHLRGGSQELGLSLNDRNEVCQIELGVRLASLSPDQLDKRHAHGAQRRSTQCHNHCQKLPNFFGNLE